MKRSAGPDTDTRDILNGLRHIVQALRISSRAAEARTGLSTAQLFALQRLAQAPGRSLGELAAATHTDPSSVSVVVRRLEERGFVARSRTVGDARRLQLSATPAGRAVLRRAPVAVQDRLVTAIDALPATRRRALVRGLTELATALGGNPVTPEMFLEEGRVRRGRR